MMVDAAKAKSFFTRQLMEWHATGNNRELPWKSEKDPYKIWLSEIILQQTRALQGLPYYNKFTSAYPTISHLAAARDEEVFLLWQGLGYYARCKNMLATARYIAGELGGVFPATYDAIGSLKGVGAYTAAAIASFAYGLPHAVVDGNVYRVLARYFAIDTPIDSTEGKKAFTSLAHELLDAKASAPYNQAIMDLGATVCTPQKPACTQCPLQKGCAAQGTELVDVLPVKSKKLKVKDRYFHYLLLTFNGTIWIHKREVKDIWQNLHEPYLVEEQRELTPEQLALHPQVRQLALATLPARVGNLKQRLTHQLIHTVFFTVDVHEPPAALAGRGMWVNANDLKNIAFPLTLLSFFKNNLYF